MKQQSHASKMAVLLYEEHITAKEIQQTLERSDSLKSYAFIKHDQDKNEQGELLKSHYHIALDFGRSFEIERLIKWFPSVASNLPAFVQPVKAWSSVLQYLIHANNPEKHQYSPDNVISNFDWQTVRANSGLMPDWFCDFDAVPYHEQAEWLAIPSNTKDYKDRAKQYRTLNENYRLYAVAKTSEVGRNMEVIFVTGEPSGVGKSTYSKFIAESIGGKSVFIAGGSRDPLDGYSGQRVIIFDDLRDSTYKFQDLLKILDNHTASAMNSRYFNKRFLGSAIVVNSITPISEWYKGEFSPGPESLVQLYRRITGYVVMTPQSVHIYAGLTDTGQPKGIPTERMNETKHLADLYGPVGSSKTLDSFVTALDNLKVK